MKEKKTGFIVLISILVLVIAVLIGMVVFLLTSYENTDNGRVKYKEETEDIVLGKDLETDTQEADKKNTAGNTNELPVVFEGYRFLIPDDYGCIIADGVGPVFYMSDIFQMRINVVDEYYEEFVKDPENVTRNAVNAGAEITKDVTETEIKGHKITWFRMMLEEDDVVAMWTPGEDGIRFGGQMVVFSEDMKDEDFLNVFVQIVGKAKKTDQPDTTQEDILAWHPAVNIGEAREKSSIRTKEFEITYKVPEGFYAQSDEVYAAESMDYYSDSFLSDDYVGVDCKVLKDIFEDAKSAISNDWNFNKSEIKTIEADGYTFYYATATQKNGEELTQYISAACDLKKDGWIYEVELIAIDSKRELTIEDIRDFLSISVR